MRAQSSFLSILFNVRALNIIGKTQHNNNPNNTPPTSSNPNSGLAVSRVIICADLLNILVSLSPCCSLS